MKTTVKKIVGYALMDNLTFELVASKESILDLENIYQDLAKTKGFDKTKPIIYEIVKYDNKNILGKKVTVNWN